MEFNLIEVVRDLSVVWGPIAIFVAWGLWDQNREVKKARRAKVARIKRRHAKRMTEELRKHD